VACPQGALYKSTSYLFYLFTKVTCNLLLPNTGYISFGQATCASNECLNVLLAQESGQPQSHREAAATDTVINFLVLRMCALFYSSVNCTGTPKYP